MRLHEYEALDIFEQNGIPVPRRGIASDMHEALRVAGEIGYPVIVKAQVLVGGRGLAGLRCSDQHARTGRSPGTDAGAEQNAAAADHARLCRRRPRGIGRDARRATAARPAH